MWNKPNAQIDSRDLKYPCAYSDCSISAEQTYPPKCYYNEEQEAVHEVLSCLTSSQRERFQSLSESGQPQFKTFDCSLMDMADDISNAVHDLEDLIARKMMPETHCRERIQAALMKLEDNQEFLDDICGDLLAKETYKRKIAIGFLVGVFVDSIEIRKNSYFSHPLFRYNVMPEKGVSRLLADLRQINFDNVVSTPEVQQLEQRGQYLVGRFFRKFLSDPKSLIPNWGTLNVDGNVHRNVCDYVAGMTDDYLIKVYQRLFIPGYGTSRDEL